MFVNIFFRICLGILHSKMAGIFGEFFLVSVSHETKHEKFGAKFGVKFGAKIQKLLCCATFLTQLFLASKVISYFLP